LAKIDTQKAFNFTELRTCFIIILYGIFWQFSFLGIKKTLKNIKKNENIVFLILNQCFSP